MKSETSNLVLLCGPSVRAFARSATAAGFRVVAVDDYCDLDLLETCDQAYRSPEDASGFDRLLTETKPVAWSYGGGWENKPGLVRRLAQIAPLWGTDAEALTRLRDPRIWTAALRDAGFLVPEMLAGEEALQPCSARRDASPERRWLSKSAVAAGGSHVRFVDEAKVEGAVVDGSPGERRFLQEFVPGHVESAAFVASAESVRFLGACRQIVGAEELGASGFLFAGAVGPLPLSDEERVFFAKLGEAVRSIAPLRGLFGVDGIRRPDGRWLPIEINPRYTASMEALERASGRSFFADHAAACGRSVGLALSPADESAMRLTAGGAPALQESQAAAGSVVGKAIVYAQAELRLDFDLGAWRDFERRFPGVTLADLPQAGTISRPGEPVLTVRVAARSPDEARAALLAAGRDVHAELLRRFGS